MILRRVIERVDPQVLHGKPCIKGTRTPAALILGYVAAGRSTAR
jgi:uncharacterized protein (DUF433 family)